MIYLLSGNSNSSFHVGSGISNLLLLYDYDYVIVNLCFSMYSKY